MTIAEKCQHQAIIVGADSAIKWTTPDGRTGNARIVGVTNARWDCDRSHASLADIEATKQCAHQILQTGIERVKVWQPACGVARFDEEEVMFRAIFVLVMAVLNFATFAPALAGEFGTREVAIAMVKRVQEKFRRDGAGATFKAITAQARVFHDRDLYPFVYDMNGVVVAHGAKADLVGKNLIDFKDQDGRICNPTNDRGRQRSRERVGRPQMD